MRDKSTVLIVDDTPANLSLLREILKDSYKIKIATNGAKALEVAQGLPPPDLILLDIMMPEMDGYEVCSRLKGIRATREIPIVFLTAKSEVEDETKGLALGAVDYITKPISPSIVQERVKTHLTLKEARDFLRHQNEILERKVLERTRQMERLQDVVMVAMGALAEVRDPETGNHIRRTQYYVKALANRLRNWPRFTDFLTPENITLLYKVAPLHDIGKVGVPDHILLKPGKLSDEEFEEMKRHTVIGRNAIAAAEGAMADEDDDFLIFAKEMTYYHHERWDGTGYPEGLVGDEIPLSARLMALADVYDALISKRVYKEAYSHDKAVAVIKQLSGSQFDPEIVDAFVEIEEEFHAISQRYADFESAD